MWLNETIKETDEGINTKDINKLYRKLQRLRAAKISISKIARAIRMNDYSKLTSEKVTEIENIEKIAPRIMDFADYIIEKREKQCDELITQKFGSVRNGLTAYKSLDVNSK